MIKKFIRISLIIVIILIILGFLGYTYTSDVAALDNAKVTIKEIRIQEIWAKAFAKRQVPQYVFGGGDGGTPTGSDTEVNTFMKLMTVEAAKNLNYNRAVNATK